MQQNEMIEFAKKLVLECGEKLREAGKLNVEYKTGIQDLVTQYDRMIEQYMYHKIQEQYPTHQFLGEENVKEMGNHLWILDPIDGTVNFVTMHRDFAISLAYYEDKKPVFGIVYDVMRDELFLGVHGEGAWLNDRKLAKPDKKKLSECVLEAGISTISYMKEQFQYDIFALQKKIRAHRSYGCASLSIVHIAQGITDIYITSKAKCWDYAAAIIILEETGGAYHIHNSFFTSECTFCMFVNQEEHMKQILKDCLP